MDDGDLKFLNNQLIEANRALITLGAFDLRERNPLISPAVRDCIQVYSQLPHCQQRMSLSVDEYARLQAVLNRLKSCLRSFGQDA